MSLRLRLSILEGPGVGEAYLAESGERVVVGRSPDCQLSLQDPGLSRRHFELCGAGTSCRLVDLGSTNGTLVNGERVQQATLRSGDRIRAGDALLRVEFFDEPPRPASRSPGPPPAPLPREEATGPTLGRTPAAGSESARSGEPMPEPAKEPETPPAGPIRIFESVAPIAAHGAASAPAAGSLLGQLFRALDLEPFIHLYALIDGAQAIELALTARVMGAELYTLLPADLAQDVPHTGPCLVPLERHARFLEAWVSAIGTHAGVLLETAADLDTLYPHLRELFIMNDEEGGEFFFRYYDPRVLHTYLPTCTPDELVKFYGPIRGWLVETEKANGYVLYRLEDSRIRQVDVGT